MATALFSGSFDPFHLGHLSVAERAAQTYDRVVVAAVGNPAKPGLHSVAERAELIAASVAHLPNVEVTHHGGLVVDLARRVGAHVVVRAAGKEAATEIVMATTNHAVAGVPTVLVAPEAGTGHISSRFVRALLAGGDLTAVRQLVPEPVADALATRAAGAR